MKRIRFWIQDYFGFSPKETTGFIVLMSLILFLLILPPLVKQFITKSDTSKSDQEQLDALIEKLDAVSTLEEAKPNVPSFFVFDPNTCSEDAFIALGIDNKTAKTILNYRNKGGKFFIKSDFKKMYGLKEKLYLQLYPYIDLPEKKQFSTKPAFLSNKAFINKESEGKKRFQPFDINLADTTQLIKINGIGHKLADRILKYRNKLGGFIHKDQLQEVYGLDTTVIRRLKEATVIDLKFVPVRINVNTASLDELRQHPYISFQIAKTIIAYREQHGAFILLSDLKDIHTINPQIFTKLEPYLVL